MSLSLYNSWINGRSRLQLSNSRFTLNPPRFFFGLGRPAFHGKVRFAAGRLPIKVEGKSRIGIWLERTGNTHQLAAINRHYGANAMLPHYVLLGMAMISRLAAPGAICAVMRKQTFRMDTGRVILLLPIRISLPAWMVPLMTMEHSKACESP